MDSLGACVHVFAQPKWLGPDEVRRVMDETCYAIEEEAALNQSEEIGKIIGESFHGARTQTDRLKTILDWAFAGRKWKKTLSSLFTDNKLAEARRGIGEVLETERLAKDTLERVCTTANIDAGHFTDGCSLQEVAQRLDQAARDPDSLFNYAIFATVLEEVPRGLIPLVEERLTRDGYLEGLPEQFEAIAIRQLAKAVYADAGSELTKYRGSRLDELRTV